MLLKELKKIFVKWADETTIHGIPNILHSKSLIVRLIWIIIFLACLGLLSWQIAVSLINYLSFNVVINYNLIHEVPTIFPTVDICNLNPYDGNQVNQVIQMLNISDPQGYFPYYINQINYITDSVKYSLEKKWENDPRTRYQDGFFLYQMLLSCQFQNKPCFESNFSYYHNFYYGSCYSFNAGVEGIFQKTQVDLQTSEAAGSKFGLQLELFVGDPLSQQEYTYLSGIKVLIRNQSIYPFPEDDGVDVSVGQQTNIAVSRTIIQHLPKPYNDCVDIIDNSNVNRNNIFKVMKTVMNQTVYNVNFCLKMCTQLYVNKSCGCYDYSLPYVSNFGVSNLYINGCSTVQELSCLIDSKLKLSDIYDTECINNCPFQCNEAIYNEAISSSAYPTEWYANNLIADNGIFFKNVTDENLLNYSNINYDYLKNTILKVNIFYDSLYYTGIVEAPAYTVDNLFGFIGGSIGLFIGMSILSVAELFEFIIHMIFHVFQCGCKGKKVKKTTEFKI